MHNEQVLEEPAARVCRLCGKGIRGRIDKKFCDDYCRNSYNNKLKGAVNNFVRNINHALGKNRRILAALLENAGMETLKIEREKLVQAGFQFRFSTHSAPARNGRACVYCYDHGFTEIDGQTVMIMKKKED